MDDGGDLSGILAAGESVLTSASGVAAAAANIGNALGSGDWEGAGAQAYALVQQAAQGSTDNALSAGERLGSQAASLGATIGTIVPIFGNVVGGAIGAIVGFLYGVAATLGGNVPGADTPQVIDAAAFLGGIYYYLRHQRTLDWWATDGRPGSRDAWWRGFPETYRQLQGSGAAPNIQLFGPPIGAKDIPDLQHALDAFMDGTWKYGGTGHVGDVPPGAPPYVPKIDYALWLAKQPRGAAIIQACVPELQAQILPLMPMAIATLLYMTYVPVLAAAKCYSPSAVDAVRSAATDQGAAAGSQVSQALSASLPSDDLTLLAMALQFVSPANPESPLWYAVPSNVGGNTGPASSLWTTFAAPLEQLVAIAAFLKAGRSPVLAASYLQALAAPPLSLVPQERANVAAVFPRLILNPLLLVDCYYTAQWDPATISAWEALAAAAKAKAAAEAQTAADQNAWQTATHATGISAGPNLAALATNTNWGTFGAGMSALGPGLAAALSSPQGQAIVKASLARPPPQIPLHAPVPPTISLADGQALLAALTGSQKAKSIVGGIIGSAQSGNPTGLANGAVLSLAARLAVMEKFVSRYVSPEAGAEILTGAHLA